MSRRAGGRRKGALVAAATTSSVVTDAAEHTVKLYPVPGGDADEFSEYIFGGKAQPVCHLIRTATGTEPDSGCEDAAAFTMWTLQDVGNWQAYNAAGVLTAFPGVLTVHTTLPSRAKDAPPTADAADIARFLSRLATHERGHGTTGEQALATIKAFVAGLPATVPTDAVPATNAAVARVLQTYQKLARAADVAYDLYTGHGLTQGAVAPEGTATDTDASDSDSESDRASSPPLTAVAGTLRTPLFQ
jgi:predicted secreted Zn-dependent protease